jgi:hypothetical protein
MRNLLLTVLLFSCPAFAAKEVITISQIDYMLNVQATDPQAKQYILDHTPTDCDIRETRRQLMSMNFSGSCRALIHKTVLEMGYILAEGCGIYTKEVTRESF